MYKGFNHFQKLNKTLQKTPKKRQQKALMTVGSMAAWKRPRGKGINGAYTVTQKLNASTSLSVMALRYPEHYRHRYGCSVAVEIFQNKHSHIRYAWSLFSSSGTSAETQEKQGTACGQRTSWGLICIFRQSSFLLGNYLLPITWYLGRQKMERWRKVFPVFPLLLGDCLCHRAMVSKCPAVARQGPCHRGTQQ